MKGNDMVTELEVIEYINRLPSSMNTAYLNMGEKDRSAMIFLANELLLDAYPAAKLTPRISALQVLFMIEGEREEYAKLKRHGIQSASAKDTSISFTSTAALSPDVLNILGDPNKTALIGRLI